MKTLTTMIIVENRTGPDTGNIVNHGVLYGGGAQEIGDFILDDTIQRISGDSEKAMLLTSKLTEMAHIDEVKLSTLEDIAKSITGLSYVWRTTTAFGDWPESLREDSD